MLALLKLQINRELICSQKAKEGQTIWNLCVNKVAAGYTGCPKKKVTDLIRASAKKSTPIYRK